MALKLQFPASLGKLDLSFSRVRNGALVTSEIVASLVISLFSVSLCSLGGMGCRPENENPARRLGLTADFSELSRRRDCRFPCQKAASPSRHSC